jgi:Fe-S-cluster containining protein
MSVTAQESSYFSDICITRCGGACCDPWWGIISYPLVKKGGGANLDAFREEVIKSIREREKRIVDAYVTNEDPPRALFEKPERYNVHVTEIKAEGTFIKLTVLAMFAFRCRFLGADKSCTLHPSVLGGTDIRPPHCGYLGSLNARPGEKGYCRIIHAAESGEDETTAVEKAIEMEKGVSLKSYKEGVRTVEDAAGRVVAQVGDYAERNLAHLAPRESTKKAGRNDPCPCGSGKKYKKCHGQ